MRVGIIGGTGPLGRGLATRLGRSGHDVVIGSRSAERANEVVGELGAPRVSGATNADACDAGEVVFATVPFGTEADTLPPLARAVGGKPLVSTIVPMTFGGSGPQLQPVAEGSVAQQCQALVPEARVVAGFHWVPAPRLLKPEATLEMDVPLCSDDAEAAGQVAALCPDISDLRGFLAGPLRLAYSLEALTPLLLSANKRYRTHLGVRFSGLRLDRS